MLDDDGSLSQAAISFARDSRDHVIWESNSRVIFLEARSFAPLGWVSGEGMAGNWSNYFQSKSFKDKPC